MNIIGFVGSPHKSGNTAWTVQAILDGAASEGANTHLFSSAELDIKPCAGCGGCRNDGGCVLKDDMQNIYAALKTADALVFGSPVYMAQMTAQAKAFTDRLYAQISPRFSPTFKEENAGKKLVVAWTQGNPDGGKFKAYLDYTAQMFALLEFEVQESVIVAGTRAGHASEQEGLAERLKNVGAALVK
ncbi:MAG: flavodoxin family protein [Oscillospiraceae bacterium]|jgi:multimeric flavodoxin WrbA|nr:flavodoxin family protein [Oscillospiraceae bacterium]